MDSRTKVIVQVCAVLVFIGGVIAATVAGDHHVNPFLTLPVVCIAWAALGFWPRRTSEKHRRFLESVGPEKGAAFMMSVNWASSVSMAVMAIGIWAIWTDATSWITRATLASGMPSGSLYYTQYPGWSIWPFLIGGGAAGTLVGNVLVVRLGRRHCEVWEEYRRNSRWVVLPRWAVPVLVVLVIASVASAAVLLPVGAVVNDDGISVREFGQVRMAFHPWSDMRELRSIHDSEGTPRAYEAVFSDGYRWRLSEETSMFDRFSSGFNEIAVVMLKHVEGRAKFVEVKG